MLTDLTIDPDIKNLCPRLKMEERVQLETNIRREGCRDPLSVWVRGVDNVLLDGHNRFEICKDINTPYDLVEIPGIYNKESAINWVINNQLGRRNLTPEEKTYLIGKRHINEKLSHQEAGARANQERLGTTAERIAKETGVHPRTVTKAEPFAHAVDAIAQVMGHETAQEIRDGKSRLTREQILNLAKMSVKDMPKAYAAMKSAPKKPAVQKNKDDPERNAQGYVMPSPREKHPIPDPIDELTKLDALWPTEWFQVYAQRIKQDSSDDGERRRQRIRGFIGPLQFKLQMLITAARKEG